MGQIEPEHLELFAVEFGKIAEYDFVYTLSSTNVNQSAANLVKFYIYTLKVSDEFDYGAYRSRISRVICP